MANYPKHLLLVNMGGIGDTLLFLSVIHQCQHVLPTAKLTVLVEERSKAVAQLLPAGVETITLKKPVGNSVLDKGLTAWALWKALQHAKQGLDVDGVICCGSSPFIAPLLSMSGLPFTIGFESSGSRALTAAAPLDTTGYAGDMYSELGKAACQAMGLSVKPLPTHPVIALTPDDQAWFEANAKPHLPQAPWCLIHPGVSQVSIQKNIVKRWVPERWAKCIQQLSPHIAPVLAGGPDDEEQLTAIQAEIARLGLPPVATLAGITQNLRHLAVCMANATHVITCDSAPMHIAVGVNAPLTALFGDFSPHRLLPENPTWQSLTETGDRINPCYIEILVADVVNAVLGKVAS
jgi:ADP-heptose:LPS heptosyltransferase